MSAKRFGAIAFDTTTQGTWATLMSGTPLFDKTAMISIVNQMAAPAVVYMAYVVDSEALEPKAEDFLLYRMDLLPYTTFHYPVLAVSEEARIMVFSNIAGVSFIATGYQDEI